MLKLIMKMIGVALFYFSICFAYFGDTDKDPLWKYVLANLSAILAFFLLIMI